MKLKVVIHGSFRAANTGRRRQTSTLIGGREKYFSEFDLCTAFESKLIVSGRPWTMS